MEEFFGDSEVEGVAQNHIEQILGLQESESKRIMKSYRRVRQELRDRLDLLASEGRGSSFTAQKARSVLVQIDTALAAMNKDLNEGMDSAADDASEMGVEHLVEEFKKWEKKFTGIVTPINLNIAKVATKANEMLFNQKEASIEGYSSYLRGRLAKGIGDAVVEQVPSGEIVSRLGQFFLGEEWRLERIVRTELHNVYNKGKITGMVSLVKGDIPDLKKTLFHPMDARTGEDSKRLAQKNPIVNVDEPFIEYSTGKRLEYMAPPNRPLDRSILIPYREVWKS